jgi:hypothetical protein
MDLSSGRHTGHGTYIAVVKYDSMFCQAFEIRKFDLFAAVAGKIHAAE